MFRNLGEVLVASHVPADYAAILARLRGGSERVADASLQVLGFTYEDLADAVCRLWGIVPDKTPVRTEDGEWLDRIVAFSHELTTSVYRRDGGDSPATLSALMQKHGTGLGLSPDTLRLVLEHGITETKQVFSSLSVSINDLRLRKQSEAALASLEAETRAGSEPGSGTPHAETTREARDRLVGTIEAAMTSSVKLDLNQTLLTILEAVFRAGPFDRTVFCVVNAARTELFGRFGLGPRRRGPPGTPAIPDFARATGGTGWPRADGRRGPRVSSSRAPGPEETQLLQHLNASTLALMPVVVDRKLVGALYRPGAGEGRTGCGHAGVPAPCPRTGVTRDRAGSRTSQSATRPRVPPPSKTAAVLRVLRGEPVEIVSREVGVTISELETWRAAFLAGAFSALED